MTLEEAYEAMRSYPPHPSAVVTPLSQRERDELEARRSQEASQN